MLREEAKVRVNKRLSRQYTVDCEIMARSGLVIPRMGAFILVLASHCNRVFVSDTILKLPGEIQLSSIAIVLYL